MVESTILASLSPLQMHQRICAPGQGANRKGVSSNSSLWERESGDLSEETSDRLLQDITFPLLSNNQKAATNSGLIHKHLAHSDV